jgi:hypothetical protein
MAEAVRIAPVNKIVIKKTGLYPLLTDKIFKRISGAGIL